MLNLQKLELDPKFLSPITLAFIGDAIYEVFVRQSLLQKGDMPVGKLHRLSVEKVRASSQAKAFDTLVETLSESEVTVLKRGRNAHSSTTPKNCDVVSYRKATGIESLFGYLYLNQEYERLNEIFAMVEHILSKKD
ncbi:MAG: ribonuclease III domain-containing protein [Oscillospiraceae bacterium]